MAAKIIVKSRSEAGRWRAGLHFTREGTPLDTDTLTEEQAKAIAADPELHCTLVSEEAAPDELALKRELKATKSAKGKKAWAEATEKARAEAELDEAAWDELADAERVQKIEAHLGKED